MFGNVASAPCRRKFKVVIRPDAWAWSGREQVCVVAARSPANQLPLRFWSESDSALGKTAPQAQPHEPGARHWLSSAIGCSGFSLNMTANTQTDQLRVELSTTGPEVKTHFASLLATKPELETKLGFELDWQELPGSEACRIATLLPDAPLDAEPRWPDYFAWFGARLTRMNEVFRPAVKDLP
jgi:hypothetical protein